MNDDLRFMCSVCFLHVFSSYLIMRENNPPEKTHKAEFLLDLDRSKSGFQRKPVDFIKSDLSAFLSVYAFLYLTKIMSKRPMKL